MPQLLGTSPNQVPTNGDLGTLAFMDADAVTISGGSIGGVSVADIVEGISAEGVDFDNVVADVLMSSPGLELRGNAKNLLTYSEQFDNANWGKLNASITANAVVAPDGSLTGDKLIESATSSTHVVFQNISMTSGTSYTFTLYAKAAERTAVAFERTNSTISSFNAYVDLTNGAIIQTGGTVTASTAAVGNGWYRISLTVLAVATASAGVQIDLALNSPATNYSGDGTSGIYIWGAQIEAGSVAGPYVRTIEDAISGASAPAVIDAPLGVAMSLPASVTPLRRSDMSFQLTSNTSLTIKVKGTDGTVRSVALTLA